MNIRDFAAMEETQLDPAHTRCTCKHSMLLPIHPVSHCLKCHKTWTARTLHYPVECPKCGYRLLLWRRRHGIPELEPPLP